MGFDLTGNQNLGSIASSPRTDVMFQEFSLYIEGVQVPFMAINIQSSLGSLPRMNIQVPSQTGLMEICRYYEPKVHVFYKDPVTQEDCLFFSGNIVSTTYYKSTQSPGQKYISFNCEHRYAKLDMVTMDYSGYASDSNASVTNTNEGEAAVKTNVFNSLQSIGMALTGIDPLKVGGSDEVNIVNLKDKTRVPQYDSVPKYLEDLKYRFTGFPGVPLNMWNQLKAQAYQNPMMYEGMTRMYIPMVEQGTQLFRRIGGHFPVEQQINDSKCDPCTSESTGDHSLETDPRLIPPAHKTLMQSAVQADISTQVIYTVGQFSGELTSYLQILQNFMMSVEYDMVFLNAPAEVPKDPRTAEAGVDTSAIDVIVKPQMPHYYSPACNVVLPHMIVSLNINQDEQSVPTRITAVNDNVPQSSGQFGVNYRAPQSVLEAIAKGIAELNGDSEHYASLARTTSSSQFKIGKYEQGRGIRHQRIQLPKWLAILAESMQQESPSSSETRPADTTPEGIQVEKFRKAWQYRYDQDEKKKQLNPWDQSSEINSYQRMLFAAANYKFTTETAKARTGNCTLIFNPYIVPGYPMDIIDPTPTEPSFHAFCVDVSHTITSRSLQTSVSFVSAMSYQELGNYEQQYTHPWLQSVTDTLSEETDETGKTIYKATIVNNTVARDTASKFYLSTLGVGAAAPEFLYDFSTGTPYPHTRLNGSPTTLSEGSTTAHVSGEGNLGLVFRPVETKAQYEERFGVKFIDMSADNYGPIVFSYEEPILEESRLMEPGESMFLDYSDDPAPSRDEIGTIPTPVVASDDDGSSGEVIA
jgi:hypothetical protein